METEVWKPVVNYEGLYEVSNWGNVRSLTVKSKGKLLSLKLAPKARYVTVKLYRNGGKEKRMWMVHRLVWYAFGGDIPEGYELNHMDTNKSNNRLDNLECVTHLDNMKHAFAMGLFAHRKYGEEHGMAKLTEEQVQEIREKYEAKNTTQRKLAREYKISQRQVGRIVRYLIWKNVK